MKQRIPKYSYNKGYADEGVSGILGKRKGFRYSDKFLKNWYADMIEIRGNYIVILNK